MGGGNVAHAHEGWNAKLTMGLAAMRDSPASVEEKRAAARSSFAWIFWITPL
jgi:hypothetical protein